MARLDDVTRLSLERAFELVRTDVAKLHRDLARAEGNRTRWIWVILWVAVADFLQHSWVSGVAALSMSAFLVGLYGLVEVCCIRRLALRTLKEPLYPMWDTRVDLS
jgi:hypothetical protein